MAYFSNGSEGEALQSQCMDCPLGAGWNGVKEELGPCPVALVQFEYNYEQCDKGQEKLRRAMNLLIDDKTRRCQVREQLVAELRPCGGRDGSPPEWLDDPKYAGT